MIVAAGTNFFVAGVVVFGAADTERQPQNGLDAESRLTWGHAFRSQVSVLQLYISFFQPLLSRDGRTLSNQSRHINVVLEEVRLSISAGDTGRLQDPPCSLGS